MNMFRKAFSWVELLVVVLVVGVLAAIAIPIMRGRVDAAKWSEGRAMAQDLAGTIRMYAEKKQGNGVYGEGQPSLSEMGMSAEDLSGKYFKYTNFTWNTKYTEGGNPPLDFAITVTAPEGISSPTTMTLNNQDVWSKKR